MKVSKQTSRVDTQPVVRSVSLQIRDYQVTLKVKTAVPQPQPRLALVRTTAR